MAYRDTFTKAFVEAALWGTMGPDGRPLIDEFTEEDIDARTLQRMDAECYDFQLRHGMEIVGKEAQAGGDFWYTRAGLACGFWDGGWSKEVGEKLKAACLGYPAIRLVVGGDGIIRADDTPDWARPIEEPMHEDEEEDKEM
jgi:hypothetical protein